MKNWTYKDKEHFYTTVMKLGVTAVLVAIFVIVAR